MVLFQSDPIPSHDGLVESQSWFRAIPFDELTNRVIIGALGTCGGQAAQHAERTIENRRQQVLYAVARMNGAKAITETLAKRRLFFAGLPGMAELLPVRESKKERSAFEAQVKEEGGRSESAGFNPARADDEDDTLDRIA